MRFLTRSFATTRRARRGQKRKRVVPAWRGRPLLLGAAAATLLTMIGGGWWAWSSALPHRLALQVGQSLVDATAAAGLQVGEVFVVGRQETTRQQLLQALNVRPGMPILALDIHEARERLLTLPWVKAASVERLLPDTVVVHISERQPQALWQSHGTFTLVDRQGQVIPHGDVGQFGGLPIVVGDDAPAHTGALIALLDTQPSLRDRVTAAIRVGGRRWNLRLDGRMEVRLPEIDPQSAWLRFAEFERNHGLLERDVVLFDLRFPDQVIVRRGAPAKETRIEVKGRDT
ncbi:MAG: FtsQ-type POTRA domain-containing protein [Rhodospirillales bacterium]|nr:MAG: FtsQ-type POTRA domain-containing protein [Rhodospirillales bacterium]